MRTYLLILGGALLGLTLTCSMPFDNNTSTGPGTVTLSWGNSSETRTIFPDLVSFNIASYVVTGNNDSTGTDAFAQTILGTSTTFSQGGLTDGTWTFTVSARNATLDVIGYGEATGVLVGSSIAVTVPVGIPSGNGTFNLVLTWPGGSLANPDVQISLGGDDYSAFVIENIPAGTISFTAQTKVSGTYLLSIALNNNGVKSWGSVEQVVILPGQTTTATWNLAATHINQPPSTVPSITATRTGINEIRLDWGAVGSATLYRIFKQENAGGWSNVTETHPTVTRIESGLTAETLFEYYIVTENAWGQSAPSAIVSSSTHTAILVSEARPDDSGDGFTAGTAKKTIGAALSLATTLGWASGAIHVEEGTYNEEITLVDGVSISGAWKPGFVTGQSNALSIIQDPDADGGTNDLAPDATVRAVNITNPTMLNAFEIGGSNATFSSAVFINNCTGLDINGINLVGASGNNTQGIGIDIVDSTLDLVNCNDIKGRESTAGVGMGVRVRTSVGTSTVLLNTNQIVGGQLGASELTGVRVLGSSTINMFGVNNITGRLGLNDAGANIYYGIWASGGAVVNAQGANITGVNGTAGGSIGGQGRGIYLQDGADCFITGGSTLLIGRKENGNNAVNAYGAYLTDVGSTLNVINGVTIYGATDAGTQTGHSYGVYLENNSATNFNGDGGTIIGANTTASATNATGIFATSGATLTSTNTNLKILGGFNAGSITDDTSGLFVQGTASFSMSNNGGLVAGCESVTALGGSTFGIWANNFSNSILSNNSNIKASLTAPTGVVSMTGIYVAQNAGTLTMTGNNIVVCPLSHNGYAFGVNIVQGSPNLIGNTISVGGNITSSGNKSIGIDISNTAAPVINGNNTITSSNTIEALTAGVRVSGNLVGSATSIGSVGNGNTITSGDATGTTLEAISAGILVENNPLIINIIANTIQSGDSTGSASGAYTAGIAVNSSNPLIKQNIAVAGKTSALDFGTSGLLVWGGASSPMVESNTFTGGTQSVGGAPSAAIQVKSNGGGVYIKNYLKIGTGLIGSTNGFGVFLMNCAGVRFDNNVIYGSENLNRGVFLYASTAPSTFRNNSIFLSGANASAFYSAEDTPGMLPILKNNILDAAYGYYEQVANAKPDTLQNNYFRNTDVAYFQSPGTSHTLIGAAAVYLSGISLNNQEGASLIANPGTYFVNATPWILGNFQLKPGAGPGTPVVILRSNGQNLTFDTDGFADDRPGDGRTLTPTWTIGAYEQDL